MDRFFEAHPHETDTANTDDRRNNNDRRMKSDRRNNDRRDSLNFRSQPLLSEAEISALLNGAR